MLKIFNYLWDSPISLAVEARGRVVDSPSHNLGEGKISLICVCACGCAWGGISFGGMK